MASEPSTLGTSDDIFTNWVNELTFTWLTVLLLTVVPAALFGSGLMAIGVLTVVVVVGVPSVLLGYAFKRTGRRGLRRLAVMAVVPALVLAYVSLVDRQIPGNATSLTQAIESFQRDTGHYPESIELLIPNHLAEVPNVRFSFIQPQITYRITDGKPFLAIPSAMGDMFAQFEYSFDTKSWMHQS